MKSKQKKVDERWENGVPHQYEAVQIAQAIDAYMPQLDLEFGGDGDMGESIILALSQWIEDGKPDCVPDYVKKHYNKL